MLHENVSPQTLGFARIAVYGAWLWHIFKDPLDKVVEVPLAYFSPIGVLRLVPEPLWQLIYTADFLSALKLAMLVGLALLVTGIGPFRVLAVFTCIMLTLYQGLVRGFGFINHGELSMLYAAYVLAAFPSADAFSFTAQQKQCSVTDPVQSTDDRGSPPLMPGLHVCWSTAAVKRGTGDFCQWNHCPHGGAAVICTRPLRPGYGHLVLELPWLALMLQVGFRS